MTHQAFLGALKRAMVPLKSWVKNFLATCLVGTVWVVGIGVCLWAAVTAWYFFTGVARQVQARQTWVLVAAMPGGDPIELGRWDGKVGGETICKIERDREWHTNEQKGRYVPLRCVPAHSWTALTIDYLFVEPHRR